MIKWNIVYRELAESLLKFQESHSRSPRKALFQLLDQNIDFKSNNRWFSLFTKHNHRESIDPFQLFVSINNRQQTDSLRIENINILLRSLGSSSQHFEIDFNGCPSLPNINLSLPKPEKDQIEIWYCFSETIQKGKNGLTKKVFNKIKSLQRLNIQTFTVFLFWIDSKSFVPLNRITENALFGRGLLNDSPDKYENYLALLERLNGDEIEDFVFPLHNYSSEVKKAGSRNESKVTLRQETTEEVLPTADKIDVLTDFRVIAIRVIKETERLTKVLKPGLYQFYQCFNFDHDGYVVYEPKKDLHLYGSDPKINISAIVGHNGSGKSTLSELLYAAINNLASYQRKLNKDLIKVKMLELDLYFTTDSLYKASFTGDNVSIERYVLSGGRYENPIEIPFAKFNFERFFYTIGINYSHYSLNSLHIGKWIDRLFHKNDGYQTPLVINPYRKQGNINVNSEYDLTRSRLLSNVLEPVPIEEKGVVTQKDLREFVEGKRAEVLEFKLNKHKFGKNYKYDPYEFKLDENDSKWSAVITTVYELFDIPKDVNPVFPGRQISWRLFVNNYLLRKLANMVIRYGPYQKFHDKENNYFTDPEALLKEIKRDNSHITFKFRQAVNFLKYHEYHRPNIEWQKGIYRANIEDMSIAIAKIKADFPNEKYKTIELIPPSFLDTEIKLSNDEHFKDLSSGEKQRIYTVSSLIYHLINIDSIKSGRGLMRYHNVNVVFDEVELYFHPEMQREFIAFLLDYLKRVTITLSGLNFQFITHSPFILSDIPLNNILFLQPDSDNLEFEPTLGANIHDMLAHNFFLKKGFMGEYTKKKIISLTKYLKDGFNDDGWDEIVSEKFIGAIGEPLIQDRLKILFELKFNQNIDQQIKDLEIQLNRLKSEKNKGVEGHTENS